MKKTKITIGILTIAFMTLSATSCKDVKKQINDTESHHTGQMEKDGQMDAQSGMDDDTTMQNGQEMAKTAPIIDNYLGLKEALVADNQSKAASYGGDLATVLEQFETGNFDDGQQKELKEIIEVAKEHGEHISESDIGHQREHFEAMGKDMVDLIAIAGTPKTLYQQYCPMYNKNKGGMWLSDSKEIKNPLFGGKMMTCGSVQKEIN
ncbi:Protein of unknown function [Pricia antarctica]|uniref:DUF3347 domain-containing protein n=1 Tax=Pricia antarctica TaxID=641691 RepID=A0A1G6YI62_9FLAO|nr:DUF3347 domain-containing protein [Pricia antarctica]SDD90002.1 Protein of unknown function [Pricia antarctica]